MSIIQRIVESLEKKNLKMKDFCEYLGINQSTLTTWKARDSDPPVKHLIRICEFLGISLEYLLTGKEIKKMPSPSQLNEDESEILDVYRQLDRRGQARILTTGYDELDRMKGGQAATAQSERSVG